jgi:hypothetical protein
MGGTIAGEVATMTLATTTDSNQRSPQLSHSFPAARTRARISQNFKNPYITML